MTRIALLTFLLGAPLALSAACSDAPPIPAFTATYAVERNGKHIGDTRVQLSYAEDGAAHYRTVTEGTRGMAALLGVDVEESAQAVWFDCHYQGQAFRYRQKVAFRKELREFQYDWTARKVVGTFKKKPWEMPIEPGYTDSLLVNLRLMTDLLLTEQETYVYPVIRKGNLKQHEYRRIGEAPVTLADGPVAAVHIQRIRDKEHRTTDLWLDPARAGVPVQVQHVEDDDTMIMRLTSYVPASTDAPPADDADAQD